MGTILDKSSRTTRAAGAVGAGSSACASVIGSRLQEAQTMTAMPTAANSAGIFGHVDRSIITLISHSWPRPSERQFHREPAALAFGAMYFHLAAVRRANRFHNGQ